MPRPTGATRPRRKGARSMRASSPPPRCPASTAISARPTTAPPRPPSPPSPSSPRSISASAFTRMTDDLRTYTEEDKKTRSPQWVAPVSTWLVSEQSREITGRVFQAGNGQFAVAEGWHKGPEAKPVLDPHQAGKILTELASKARKNAGMNGLDLD